MIKSHAHPSTNLSITCEIKTVEEVSGVILKRLNRGESKMYANIRSPYSLLSNFRFRDAEMLPRRFPMFRAPRKGFCH